MKTTYISKKIIDTTLKTKIKKGNRVLDPLASFSNKKRLPFKIIEDNNIMNPPELHVQDGDLFFCLEGKIDFVCGGLIIRKENRINPDGTRNHKEQTGIRIRNGQSFKLRQGDWLWIPPNTPHQHGSDGSARVMVIKIPIHQK